MIRRLPDGRYRLDSRTKDPRTGKTRGAREVAEEEEL